MKDPINIAIIPPNLMLCIVCLVLIRFAKHLFCPTIFDTQECIASAYNSTDIPSTSIAVEKKICGINFIILAPLPCNTGIAYAAIRIAIIPTSLWKYNTNSSCHPIPRRIHYISTSPITCSTSKAMPRKKAR